ncbi:hypothetical protein B0H67DRAFT_566393, partial [Lasiosphaeris hirsuta]
MWKLVAAVGAVGAVGAGGGGGGGGELRSQDGAVSTSVSRLQVSSVWGAWGPPRRPVQQAAKRRAESKTQMPKTEATAEADKRQATSEARQAKEPQCSRAPTDTALIDKQELEQQRPVDMVINHRDATGQRKGADGEV